SPAGAALALVEDESLLSSHPEADRLVCVPDTLVAFQSLANWWRRELNLPTLAVTGSVGKTTTKEIMAAILLQRSRGVYSVKSHNNHTGVPYTILKAGREHEWLVLEMGMNHAGELTVLSKIGEPDVCGITCIAPSHIGNLGSLEGIRSAKLEIISGLRPNGVFFSNANDEFLAAGVKTQQFVPGQRILSFGSNPGDTVRIVSVQSHGLEGITISLALYGANGAEEQVTAKMDLIGRHNAGNVAAAVLGVRALFPEISAELIQRGLTSFRAPLMRLNLKTIPDGRLVIDDSYNAGPDSMRALLELGADLQKEGKVIGCVLGDMRELGDFTERYHREVGEYIAKLRPAFVVTVGEWSRLYLEAAKAAGIPATQAENPEVAAHLAQKRTFDILMVKASRGVGLDRTVKTLERV
ncbi:MAG: UDP-N-acetylmuramoyl-tripeptide--D-alanyl-D-alanine ligase, partial [Proteobacteria bacterium]|nr:UDP-N-acetylmuramoyl-tripeptide--D-alanyl-D-alanine ligase [Pseudomonadota bacterium]